MIKIEIIPVPKPRMTQADKWKQRPEVIRYRAFADELRYKMGRKKVPVPLKIQFQMPMPSGWSEKKKSDFEGKPHEIRPDIDNLLKAFLDVMMTEDCHVWKVSAEKIWARDGALVIEEDHIGFNTLMPRLLFGTILKYPFRIKALIR